MKKSFVTYFLFSMCLLISVPALSQSKKDLEYQIKYLISEQKKQSDEIQNLKDQITELKSGFSRLNEENNRQPSSTTNSNNRQESSSVVNKEVIQSDGRCQAKTAKGSQCSRNAEPGTLFCWQHKGSSQPINAIGTNQTSSESPTTTKPSTGSSNYSGSKTIQTGSRGGRYYINKNGNKTYVKRK